MKKNQTTSLTYDPNLEPFYKSKVKYNDKYILLYDLDTHCNNLLLSKKSFMVEYYNNKNEALIIPKLFAENLYLTDDNILDTYIKTQQSAREKIKRQMETLSVVTLLYIIIAVLSIFNLIKFSLLFVTIPFVIFYAYMYFYKKNQALKISYKNYIYILTKKYGDEVIIQNLKNIMAHAKELDYMYPKQKLRTIKHFQNLENLITKKK